MSGKLWRIAASALPLLALSAAANADDAGRGRQLYESRCSACHSLDANRAGPAHRGVFGRRAGQSKDYDYSPALRKSRLVWNAANLDRWLADPEKLIPGQKMGFSVPDAGDRAALIDYLKAESRQ